PAWSLSVSTELVFKPDGRGPRGSRTESNSRNPLGREQLALRPIRRVAHAIAALSRREADVEPRSNGGYVRARYAVGLVRTSYRLSSKHEVGFQGSCRGESERWTLPQGPFRDQATAIGLPSSE